MTLDEQRRLFVRRTCIVGIVRRIEQTEGRVSTFGGKFHGLDRSEIVGDAQVRMRRECRSPSSGVRCWPDVRSSATTQVGRDGAPATNTTWSPSARTEANCVNGVSSVCSVPVARSIDRQFPEPCLRIGADDAVRPGEGVSGHAESPLRLSELRRHRRNRARGARRKLVAVQVPPARPVGHEDDAGCRRATTRAERSIPPGRLRSTSGSPLTAPSSSSSAR